MQFIDSLKNLVANLGTNRDKSAHNQYVFDGYDPVQLSNIYRGSWLGRAIVDYPAEDSTRKWRSWRGDKEQIAKLEELEASLNLKKTVKSAVLSARLFGGSAIYINTPTADQSSPLKVGEEVKSLVVLGRNQITPSTVVKDINSEYYGRPEYFTIRTGDAVNSRDVEIHISRFCLFNGAEVPVGADYQLSNFWGDSVLSSTMQAIEQTDSTMANIASLVFEAKVDVFKFAGFADMLKENPGTEKLTSRLVNQAAMKGINGAVVIDATDDYEQKTASFGSLPEIISKFQDTVSGAARIPVTRLFGRASVGLSGSGDGDERVYYDRIGDGQSSIGDAIKLLDRCIITQALGRPDSSVYYEWNPLRQVTEMERADIFSKTASAARSLAGTASGPILPLDALSDSVANELIEQGVLPGLESALEQYGTMGEQNGFTGEEQ